MSSSCTDRCAVLVDQEHISTAYGWNFVTQTTQLLTCSPKIYIYIYIYNSIYVGGECACVRSVFTLLVLVGEWHKSPNIHTHWKLTIIQKWNKSAQLQKTNATSSTKINFKECLWAWLWHTTASHAPRRLDPHTTLYIYICIYTLNMLR